MNPFNKTFTFFAFVLISSLTILTSCQDKEEFLKDDIDIIPTTEQMVGTWTATLDDDTEIFLAFKEIPGAVMLTQFLIKTIIEGEPVICSGIYPGGYSMVIDGKVEIRKSNSKDYFYLDARFKKNGTLKGTLKVGRFIKQFNKEFRAQRNQ